MSDAWIQTYTGRRFYPFHPTPESIDIEDIAHALSLVCRFTGHCTQFYSVAQHSLMVADLVPAADRLWGLMHDASEAYIMDLARPIKRTREFDQYRVMEKGIMDAICVRFDMPTEEPESIKQADLVALATEARDLMPMREREPWGWLPDPLVNVIQPEAPGHCRDAFLDLFHQLRHRAA